MLDAIDLNDHLLAVAEEHRWIPNAPRRAFQSRQYRRAPRVREGRSFHAHPPRRYLIKNSIVTYLAFAQPDRGPRVGRIDGRVSEGLVAGTTVVVGSAQGIGEAVARRLARADWAGSLVLADLDFKGAEAVAADLRNAGFEARAAPVDLRLPESVDALVAAAPGADRVAIVAGIFAAAPSLDVDRAEFERVLSVNLVGVYFVAQAFAKEMVKRGAGSICAVGSIAARMPRMRQAAYSASKAGMRQALRVLALETVPAGVRINFVAPGPTDTPMMRQLTRDHPHVDLAMGSPGAFRPPVPDRRVASSDEIASAVAFLLSPDADHIALHDLYVDGGETLGL